MDLRRIRLRFHQWGGFRLVKEYARLGVLPAVGFGFVRILLSGKSPKQLNALISQKMEPILQEKYQTFLRERKAYYDGQKLEHRRSKVVWFCWLQGLEQAPSIVMACYRSLRQHLTDREIRSAALDTAMAPVSIRKNRIAGTQKAPNDNSRSRTL